MGKQTYEELQKKVRRLQAEGRLPKRPTSEQQADWAYGNTVIENEDITREMAQQAVQKREG